MFICIDTHYSPAGAVAAGVVFRNLQSDVIEKEYVRKIEKVEAYCPGQFYKRELPGILALLQEINDDIHTIIIDGYVWLSSDSEPGLGAHLFNSLDAKIPVIGVAKNPYKDISMAVKVFRGKSKRPLYVTAASMVTEQAALLIQQMHGPYRLPTLLKHVDALSRKTALYKLKTRERESISFPHKPGSI